MNTRELFFRHLAQTAPDPLALEIVKAEGCYLIDTTGKRYLDLVGGISVANTGHRHPAVIDAIRTQLESYLHVMVYGEFIESPQVRYAKMLADHLPPALNTVYFTSSGSEAVEGAMKLAKRVTGKTGIVAFDKAYHGSTQGALSIMGDENWRNAFRPLLPGITHAAFNSFESLEAVNESTACVVAETIQGEAGVIVPDPKWLQELRRKCTETGCLLVLDEIQCGFGRTGRLWGFEHFDIIPDILILGKALGGGLPLGAFISDKKLLDQLTENPALGHITTFGGHPLCCAAGMAAMQVLLDEELADAANEKGSLIRELLVHPKIKQVRAIGLWLSIEFESPGASKRIIDHCLEQGVFVDWFLFSPESLRISPPLTITQEQLRESCEVILQAIEAS